MIIDQDLSKKGTVITGWQNLGKQRSTSTHQCGLEEEKGKWGIER